MKNKTEGKKVELTDDETAKVAGGSGIHCGKCGAEMDLNSLGYCKACGQTYSTYGGYHPN